MFIMWLAVYVIYVKTHKIVRKKVRGSIRVRRVRYCEIICVVVKWR